MARRTWNDMGDAGAERWKARYEQRHAAPILERDESMRGRGRERERHRGREQEREREREREREMAREREREGEMEIEEQPTGNCGGFTAVNG